MYDAVINYRCQVMCIDDADNPYVGHANTHTAAITADISDTRTAPLSHEWSPCLSASRLMFITPVSEFECKNLSNDR